MGGGIRGDDDANICPYYQPNPQLCNVGVTDMSPRVILFPKRRRFRQLLVIDRVWDLQMQGGTRKTEFYGLPRRRVTPFLCEACNRLDGTKEIHGTHHVAMF
jgi:hypothetical protein